MGTVRRHRPRYRFADKIDPAAPVLMVGGPEDGKRVPYQGGALWVMNQRTGARAAYAYQRFVIGDDPQDLYRIAVYAFDGMPADELQQRVEALPRPVGAA